MKYPLFSYSNVDIPDTFNQDENEITLRESVNILISTTELMGEITSFSYEMIRETKAFDIVEKEKLLFSKTEHLEQSIDARRKKREEENLLKEIAEAEMRMKNQKEADIRRKEREKQAEIDRKKKEEADLLRKIRESEEKIAAEKKKAREAKTKEETLFAILTDNEKQTYRGFQSITGGTIPPEETYEYLTITSFNLELSLQYFYRCDMDITKSKQHARKYCKKKPKVEKKVEDTVSLQIRLPTGHIHFKTFPLTDTFWTVYFFIGEKLAQIGDKYKNKQFSVKVKGKKFPEAQYGKSLKVLGVKNEELIEVKI